MTVRLWLIAALLLAGCAQRGAITLEPAAEAVGAVQPILVAASRQPEAEGPGFQREPGGGLAFAAMRVSVPPQRDPGTVTFPNATPDPARDFLTLDSAPIPDASAFIRAVNATVAAQPPNQREAFVFVHGFNTNFAEGLYRQAQMRHDFGSPGISVHYSWPSAGNVRAYATDREAVLEARDDLEALIDLLASSKVTRIVVAGHSMGAFLVMEALRQKAIRDVPGGFAKIETVILMAPDIDVGVFRRQARDLEGQGVSIYVFASSRDRALRFSAALRGTGNRLGALQDTAPVADLPVTVIDLSGIEGNQDALNHFKVATSPIMISMMRGLTRYGSETLRDEARSGGLLDTGISVVQGATSVVLTPLAER